MRARGYLAFIIGLCATAALCLFVTAGQEQQIRNNFQRDTEKVARDTSVRLHTYFDMLLSLLYQRLLQTQHLGGDGARMVA